MSESVSQPSKGESVPERIFEAFLDQINREKVSEETISRLKKVLLEDKAYNGKAIRTALFPEDPGL